MELRTCRCCCCQIPLANACRGIGITFAVISAMSAAKLGMALVAFQGAVDSVTSDTIEEWERKNNMQWESVVEIARSMLLVQLSVNIMWTVFSILLVIGVAKENKCLVLAFVVFFGLALVLMTVSIIYAFYDPWVLISELELQELRKEHGTEVARNVVLALLCCFLAILLFFWYLFVVVHSYYKQLVGSGERQEFGQIPMV